MFDPFDARLARLRAQHQAWIARPNAIDPAWDNGVYVRYQYSVVTAAHVPLA